MGCCVEEEKATRNKNYLTASQRIKAGVRLGVANTTLVFTCSIECRLVKVIDMLCGHQFLFRDQTHERLRLIVLLERWLSAIISVDYTHWKTAILLMRPN